MSHITVESSVKQIWNAWDIRLFMLTSLLIQALLTFLAPHRKRSSSRFLKFCMWLLYLSADAVAIFTIGLITSSQGDSPQKLNLLAFWAPFLLLHLGGPDTITALALEDNELWHRHALQLASQIMVTLYVFGQSLRGNNHLWLPTVLMFLDGCIKYTERTEALYFACMENFREPLEMVSDQSSEVATGLISITIQDTCLNNKKKSQGRVDDKYNLNHSTSIKMPCDTGNARGDATTNKDADADIDEDAMINDAYKLCMKFKGLLADAFVSLKDRDDSRKFFLSKAVPKAYRLIEIELNFIYDVFYTKVFLLQMKQAYARIISFFSVIASLLLFTFKEKSHYHKIDVGITYALLGGAIALDTFSVLMLVESDWWIIITPKLHMPKKMRSFLMHLRQFLRRTRSHSRTRWSESISRYNLLDRCFKDPPTIFKYVFMKRIKHALMGFLYVESKPVDELVNFIIEELRKKAKLAADDAKTISKEDVVCAARGNLVLESDYHLVSENLHPWTSDVDYDESVLVWHLATDICYWTTDHDNVKGKDYRNFCKQISDYMSYLLLRRKVLVSVVVGMSENRFEDTRKEAKKYMDRNLDVCWIGEIFRRGKKFVQKKLKCQVSSFEDQNHCSEKDEIFFKEFCKKILKLQPHVQSTKACDKNKSVLFDACRLAKQLKMFRDCQWEITSKVWVELLCYAATTRCSPTSHVAQLCKGGELITLVWLLMAHLGLGERFLAKAKVWVD